MNEEYETRRPPPQDRRSLGEEESLKAAGVAPSDVDAHKRWRRRQDAGRQAHGGAQR